VRRLRWWTSRWFQIAVAIVLATELWYWGTYSRNHFALAAMGVTCITWKTRMTSFHWHEVYCVREGDGLRIVDVDGAEGETLAEAVKRSEADPAFMSVFPYSKTAGLLAPVVRTWDVHFVLSGGDLTPAEQVRARALFADWLAQQYSPRLLDQVFLRGVRNGDQVARRVHPHWFAHDVLTAALTVLWTRSLIVRPPRLAWLSRAERRRRRGECPQCGYPRRDIVPDASGSPVCPECGLQAVEERLPSSSRS
jgi:hypothetical protein